MIIKGNVVGYQIFKSGAAQLFVSCPAEPNEKVKEFGSVVRAFWRAKGTYDFDNPPDLINATVVAFVGKNETGILDISEPTVKGGGK